MNVRSFLRLAFFFLSEIAAPVLGFTIFYPTVWKKGDYFSFIALRRKKKFFTQNTPANICYLAFIQTDSQAQAINVGKRMDFTDSESSLVRPIVS